METDRSLLNFLVQRDTGFPVWQKIDDPKNNTDSSLAGIKNYLWAELQPFSHVVIKQLNKK